MSISKYSEFGFFQANEDDVSMVLSQYFENVERDVCTEICSLLTDLLVEAVNDTIHDLDEELLVELLAKKIENSAYFKGRIADHLKFHNVI